MRVAVTGAAGYLGRPIVEALARDDRVDSVVAIDLRPPAPADGVEPLRRDRDLRVVRMRPVSALGRGAPVMLRGRAWISLSDYDPLIQFVWLDDLVDAFVRAVHQPVSGPFNVGAPDPVRVSEVAELLGVRSVRLPHRVVRLAARLPGGMHPAWVDVLRYPIVGGCSRAERGLGWRGSW